MEIDYKDILISPLNFKLHFRVHTLANPDGDLDRSQAEMGFGSGLLTTSWRLRCSYLWLEEHILSWNKVIST
jgi:hypothetical protein